MNDPTNLPIRKNRWIILFVILLVIGYLFITLPNYLFLDLPKDYPVGFDEKTVRTEFEEFERAYYIWRVGCYECLLDENIFTALDSSLLQSGWEHSSDPVNMCLDKLHGLDHMSVGKFQLLYYKKISHDNSADNRFPATCLAMWTTDTNLHSIVLQTVNLPRWLELIPK